MVSKSHFSNSTFVSPLEHCAVDREAACFHSFAFRRCDYKNLGVSFLCNFEEQIQGQQIQPPIWGQNVLKQYLDEINEVPEYLESLARNSNKRLFADESGNQIFAAANVEVDETGEKIPKSYDAYERDIAMVTFFFETNTVFEYSRDQRLGWIWSEQIMTKF